MDRHIVVIVSCLALLALAVMRFIREERRLKRFLARLSQRADDDEEEAHAEPGD